MEALDPMTARFWGGLGMAVLCGAIVGLERRLKGKPAGMRTGILICLATFLFVRLGGSVAGATADPARVLGQVVTGIGFLGAGVILAQQGLVHGVTTAAVIWMLAAIGAAVGLDHFAAALVFALVTVAVLRGIEWIEDMIPSLPYGGRDETRYRDEGDD